MTEEEIIDKMTLIRSANNLNWMGIYRLALRYVPWNELKPFVMGIRNHDQNVNDLNAELYISKESGESK